LFSLTNGVEPINSKLLIDLELGLSAIDEFVVIALFSDGSGKLIIINEGIVSSQPYKCLSIRGFYDLALDRGKHPLNTGVCSVARGMMKFLLK